VGGACNRSRDSTQDFLILGEFEIGPHTFTECNAVADAVTKVAGQDIVVDKKFVEDWANSLRNPSSPEGRQPWA
jgi:hypothetical protein